MAGHCGGANPDGVTGPTGEVFTRPDGGMKIADPGSR